MRAGVLSDDQNIEFLNENFINTWVANAELGRTSSLQAPIARRRARESKTFDTTHALAKAIMKGWQEGSPVDCLVISHKFELMGKLPINDFLDDTWEKHIPEAESYRTFLKEALEGKSPGFGEINWLER